MCGIAAIIDVGVPDGRDHPASRDRELLTMLSHIRHRGDPELFAERGTWPGAALGTNRLAIVDRANARQPQTDDRGRIRNAYNGELYGFSELRRDLVGK